ncbi:related to Vacuolar protein sorting-associated protein 13 [Saccharomycodes ludwigii]|uniref:Related to Vacuolar protein sorting-associated protein 13 n=1 Tax=Saccharomycodes ludwigii TaxID=36035 RepID=A0A376B3A6_9ASCO|nr:related to Vacuolar protein sorting-associated protein 13 [Saccharomycodes ludwigii]
MLESFAATFLNRILGSYVENFDENQLEVGIWNGDAKLKNLKLRKDALDALQLPLDVKSGILGDLTLIVPWSSLKNKPVKIVINDVFLLAVPRTLDSYDSEEDAKREFKRKMATLNELEMANDAKPADDANSKKNQSFTQNLITKIIDNVQITFKNIHIRYEDLDCIFSEDPYCVGVTLNELSAVSTNENWMPSFISITQEITHKLLSLNSLSLYWNTNCKDTIFDMDTSKMIDSFKSSIVTEDNTDMEYQYLLAPVTGTCRLSLNKLGSTETNPHIEALLDFSKLGLTLDDNQYKELLGSMSKYQWFKKSWKYRKLRPKYTVSENPKGWFKYVANCVLNEVHDKNYKKTWDYIKERKVKEGKYIALWKKKLAMPDLLTPLPNVEDENELDKLNADLPIDDIRFFRTLAKKEYLKEKINAPPGSSDSNGTNKSQNNWISNWWYGNNSSQTENLEMTEEQKQELYDAIDFDENNEIAEYSTPDDRITLRITSKLDRGSLTLKDKANNLTLGEMIFENCQTELFQRPNSYGLNFKLFQFTVVDGSPNTLNKHIVKVNTDSVDNSKLVTEGDPFFLINFEHNPLDIDADSSLGVKLQSMSIYYHVHFINRVMQFFKPPRQHYDTIAAIMSAAESTVETWTTQTRMGIEALLEEHQTFDVNLDLQTPLIIIPLDPHVWDTPCAIIDAGHISMVSDLVSREKIKELKKLSVEDYNKIDPKDVNRLMFDRFKLCLDNAQFLVGPDIRSTISSSGYSENDNQYAVLEKMHFEFVIDICILPKALNLPKIRTTGVLPTLKVCLNDYQYKIIMNLIATCLPNTNNETEDDAHHIGEAASEKISERERSNILVQRQLRQTKKYIDSLSKDELVQRSFQMKLDVDSTEIVLKKCVDRESMKAETLVSIGGDKLNFTFGKTPKDMYVTVGLANFYIEDFMYPDSSKELKYIVTSSKVSDDFTLFDMNYKRSQRLVEYETSLIEVYDQDIDLQLSALKVVLNSKSILTLLNYIMTTFTDPTAENIPADVLRHNAENLETSPQKINLCLKMDQTTLLIVDEFEKIATMELSKGMIDLIYLPEKMKVVGRLGSILLRDELHHNLNVDSDIRQIISMVEDEVAEFTYETFDTVNNTNDYTSSFDFKSSSIKINFIEQTINRIFEYFSTFQKTKTIFDKAREAAYNQAPSIDTINKLKLNVLVKTPIIKLPKVIDPKKGLCDDVTFYLGEFYLSNSFTNTNSKAMINRIQTGLRSTKVTSFFNFSNCTQKSNMVDNLDLIFNIDFNSNPSNLVPALKIKGNLSPLFMKLTETQVNYLLDLFPRIAATFSYDANSTTEDIENEAIKANDIIAPHNNYSVNTNIFNDLETKETKQKDPDALSLDLSFSLPDISLSLYDNTSNVEDIEQCGLTTISLHDSGFAITMKNNGSYKGNGFFSAFSIEDTRENKENKHVKLIPAISSDRKQFQIGIEKILYPEKNLINLFLTIDSPKIILAVDYLISLRLFSVHCFASPSDQISLNVADKTASIISGSETLVKSDASKTDEMKTKFNYVFDMIDSSVILLADPSDLDSEAVVFRVGRTLITHQDVFNIRADKIGMFLCNMESFDKEHIRLIDDFCVSGLCDSRSTENKIKTDVTLLVDPLVMRLSLRDIRLAMDIFNKAVSMATEKGLIGENGVEKKEEESGLGQQNAEVNFSREFKLALAKYAPSVLSDISWNTMSDKKDDKIQPGKVALLCSEKFQADFQGMRLALIGDINELPMLDLDVKPFSLQAKDWSGAFDAISTFETYVNIFNYSKSSWEPLIEQVPFTFHISKNDIVGDADLSVDLYSKKLSEITLTSQSISLLSTIPESIYNYEKIKPRGEIKPYRIINDIGEDLEVWIDTMNGGQTSKILLHYGDSIPWEFEDWRKVRENLDTDNTKLFLGFRVKSDDFQNSFRLDVSFESEDIYTLLPPTPSYHHRICCKTELGSDNVKTITFSSSLTMYNQTANTIEVRINGEKSVFVEPDARKSVPFRDVFTADLLIRPVSDNLQYTWSETPFTWKTLLMDSMFERCEEIESSTGFYFKMEAKYNKMEKLARVYPHMEIEISPPIEVENLLPYDMKFELVAKNKGESFVADLPRGESIPVHNINFDDFIFFRLSPKGSGYYSADYSLISVPKDSSVGTENKIEMVKRSTGETLFLNIHYHKKHDSNNEVLKIYAPYIILNGTERDIYVRANQSSNIFSSKVRAIANNEYVSAPEMFSFNEDQNKQLAQFKMRETEWSKATTIEVVGQSIDLKLSIPNKTMESELGIHISEGEGKYKLTKSIYINPRYIMKNSYKSDLVLAETMSKLETVLNQSASYPLYNMSLAQNKFCRLAMPGGKYSEAFKLGDIGTTYVKLFDSSRGKHILVKIETVCENATLFLEIKDSQSDWPFSLRNFSPYEFIMYQRDPSKLDSDGSYYADANQDSDDYNESLYLKKPQFEPIAYQLLSYTMMPFSWDFPSAKEKRLIIEYKNKRRSVDLREIGNLRPMQLEAPSKDYPEGLYAELNIMTDGPIQALVITKYNEETSMYKLKSKSKKQKQPPALPPRVSTSSSNNNLEPRMSVNSTSSVVTTGNTVGRSNNNNGSGGSSSSSSGGGGGGNSIIGTTSNNSSSATLNSNDKFVVNDDKADRHSFLKVSLSFEGLGISLINHQLQELCYVNIKGLEFKYNNSKLYQTFSWKLKWIQIDNQLFGGLYPNVVYPTIIPDRSEELDNHPVFSGSISKVNDETRGLTYFKHATILLQELTVKLDEDFVLSLIDFLDFPGASWHMLVQDKLYDDTSYDSKDEFVITLPHSSLNVESNDIYFETLHLQPTVLHLSFMRTEHINSLDDSKEVEVPPESALMMLVNVLTMALGNVNDAPIQLNSLLLENLKVSTSTLLNCVKEHYRATIFSQLYKIVGYADVFGNPIGLFNNLSSGFYDIFYRPYQGYVMNDRPEELGISIAKGSISFFKMSVYGFSDSVSKLTGSVAKGLSAATQDKSFQQRRLLQQRQNRYNHDINGFSSGFNSLVNGVASGLTGVARDPIEGAKKQGTGGFLKGLGKGLIGIPTKTVIGFLDMASNVSEGIKNTTTVLDANGVRPVRFPRFLGENKVVKSYNERESQGQYWLKMCNGGQYMKDHYVAHVLLPGKETILCVSQERIAEINICNLQCICMSRLENIESTPIDDGRQLVINVVSDDGQFVVWKYPIPNSNDRRMLLDAIIMVQKRARKYLDATP